MLKQGISIHENEFVALQLSQVKTFSIWFIKKYLDLNPVVLLRGPLGAGKSTIVSSILNELGFKKTQGSPTFPIVLQYPILPLKNDAPGETSRTLYHMDWYRIDTESDLEDRGITEILNQLNSVVFIEWAEKFPNSWNWMLNRSSRAVIELEIQIHEPDKIVPEFEQKNRNRPFSEEGPAESNFTPLNPQDTRLVRVRKLTEN